MLTTVVLIVVMLLLSAFFSGMEIAFTSKNRLKLEIDRKPVSYTHLDVYKRQSCACAGRPFVWAWSA